MDTQDAPRAGKRYRLTGGANDKAISNGHSWAESEVKCILLHDHESEPDQCIA